jgi:hypothetical protein
LDWAKCLHAEKWYVLIKSAAALFQKEKGITRNKGQMHKIGKPFSTVALQCANMAMLHSVLSISKHAPVTERTTPEHKQQQQQHEAFRTNHWREIKASLIRPQFKDAEKEQKAIIEAPIDTAELGCAGHLRTFLESAMQTVSLMNLCMMVESENMKVSFASSFLFSPPHYLYDF